MSRQLPGRTPPSSDQAIWLMLIIVCAMIVAVGAGAVLRFLGADLVTAVSAGGAAWLGAAGIGLGFRRFLN